MKTTTRVLTLLTFGLLSLLLIGVLPAAAQADDLTQTYTDDFITFNYPEGWFKCTCPEDDNTLAIGNTEDAPSTADLKRREVQVLIVKSAAIWIEDNLQVDFEAETPEEVLEVYFRGEDIETDRFTGRREAAWMFVENASADLESLFIVVELGNDELGMLVATTRPGYVEDFEDTLLAIADTLVASEGGGSDDNDIVSSLRDSLNSGSRSSSGDDDPELTEAFEMEDGNFALSYPDGWLVGENEGAVIMVSSDAVLDVEAWAELEAGDVAIFIYPTVELLNDYPEGMSRGTVPSTIVSFYASMAMIEGLTQNGPMEAPEIGRGQLLASSAYSTLSREYDQYVFAIENGDDDIITLFAYSAPGAMEDLIPTIHAIAASFTLP